jgi:type I restriction enzyme S subunit
MAEIADPIHRENSVELPEGWQVSRLADVADLASGGTPSKQRPDFWSGVIPWASPKDLKRSHLYDAEDHISQAGLEEGSRLAPVGALFIVVRGMILSRDIPVARAMVPMAFNQDMKAILPKSDVDGDFLLYALIAYKSSLLYEIGFAAHGTKRISTAAIEDFRLPLPTLPEQEAIAHVLRTVQRAKEATENVLSAARQFKASLLRHLFTYGPVQFDRAERMPLKETEIGPVPEHWPMSTVGEAINKGPQNGIYKPKTDYGTGTPIVRINDFENDGSIVSAVPNRVNIAEAESRTYSLSPDDLVVNRVNSLSHLGKTALVGKLSEPTVFESNMMRFGVDPERVRPRYLFHFLNSAACRNLLRNKSKRAVAQSSINQEDVKALPLPLPTVAEQETMLGMLTAVDTKIAAEYSRRSALDTLFQSLLHSLMTGKVRVRDLPASMAEGGEP